MVSDHCQRAGGAALVDQVDVAVQPGRKCVAEVGNAEA